MTNEINIQSIDQVFNWVLEFIVYSPKKEKWFSLIFDELQYFEICERSWRRHFYFPEKMKNTSDLLNNGI